MRRVLFLGSWALRAKNNFTVFILKLEEKRDLRGVRRGENVIDNLGNEILNKQEK